MQSNSSVEVAVADWADGLGTEVAEAEAAEDPLLPLSILARFTAPPLSPPPDVPATASRPVSSADIISQFS